jgi:isopentenyl phosphate kinase
MGAEMEKNLVIVKFGGSVITTKTGRKAINRKNLDLICSEIGEAYKSSDKNLIIIHGGGSYGHPLARKLGFRYSRQVKKNNKNNKGTTLPSKSRDVLSNYSKIKTTMEVLNMKVVEFLLSHDAPAIAFHPSDFCVTNEGEIESMYVKQIESCLQKREISVLHGDVVKDKVAGTVILSGDQILSYLAREFKDFVSFVVVGTDVDGVFTKDPKIARKKASRIERITPESFNDLKLKFTTSQIDVTGGMRQKVETLVELAKDGIDSVIIDIKQKDVLSDLITKGLPESYERGTVIKS